MEWSSSSLKCNAGKFIEFSLFLYYAIYVLQPNRTVNNEESSHQWFNSTFQDGSGSGTIRLRKSTITTNFSVIVNKFSSYTVSNRYGFSSLLHDIWCGKWPEQKKQYTIDIWWRCRYEYHRALRRLKTNGITLKY